MSSLRIVTQRQLILGTCTDFKIFYFAYISDLQHLAVVSIRRAVKLQKYIFKNHTFTAFDQMISLSTVGNTIYIQLLEECVTCTHWKNATSIFCVAVFHNAFDSAIGTLRYVA